MGVVKYTGPVASFHCPTNAEIRSLKVHFSPKQEGSGDPSPENVREIVGWDGVKIKQSGKNLIDINLVKHGHPSVAYHSSDESNDMIFANGELSGTVTEGWRDTTVFSQLEPFDPGTYTLSFDYENKAKNYSWRPICITSTYSGWYTAYKSVAPASSEHGHIISTFTADVPFYISMCLNSFGNAVVTAKNRIYNINLELGSTATSYEPYHGSTTNYEFGVLGKNKFDYANADIKNIKRMDDNGNEVSDPYASYSQLYTPVVPSTQYTISGFLSPRGSQKRVYYYDKNKTFISRSDGYSKTTTDPFTIITPSNCYYVQFQLVNDNDGDAGWDTLQLELGSTATTYEPYDPKHTVYGGWVDLISGEVCDNWWTNTFEVAANEGTVQTRGLRRIAKNLPSAHLCDTEQRTKSVCSQLLYLSNSNDTRPNFSLSKNTAYMYIPNDNTAYTFEIFYPSLTTNATYQIAPTSLQTFLGHNNVWSNADYVEVEYDLHETQDILARK